MPILLDFFLLFTVAYLLLNAFNCVPPHSNLVFNYIRFVFRYVPPVVEKFIAVLCGVDCHQITEGLEVLESQVQGLGGVEVASLAGVKLDDDVIVFLPGKDTKDVALLSPDDGHEGRVVGVFDALVNHVHD